MWWDKPGTKKAAAEAAPFPFMKFRWVGFIVTGIIAISTTVSLATQGLNLGLDFTGGVQVEATTQQVFDTAVVRAEMEKAGFGEDVGITPTDAGKTVLIRLPLHEGATDVSAITNKVTQALGPTATVRKTDSVGAKVSGELFQGGVIASLIAVGMIGLYVWFRFESKFGWGAFITTLHDVYAVVGLFSITRWTFDLTIVAGVLTVAGYSINDTVVVFDRIREMLKKYKKMPLSRIIDISITSTLSRTLITSLATMIAAVSMLLLGGPVLRGFAASIVFGILIGTYSSIFVAAPMLIYLPGRTTGSRFQKAAEGKEAEAAT
ncbi:MAG TPA: protein translocase subunit SecF [Hyphomonadaceae bacterium]|nr:protein translocase subunit SecF [Hyphomonadaceae bacterium]